MTMVTEEELKDMGKNMDFADALHATKEALETAYPNSRFLMFGADHHPDENGKPKRIALVTKHGEWVDLEKLGVDISKLEPALADFCRNVMLTEMVNIPVETFKHRIPAAMHDAILDYAVYMGLDTTGYKFCRDTRRWRGLLPEYPDKKKSESDGTTCKVSVTDTPHVMGQKVAPVFLEAHITQVKKELSRLLKMRDPLTLIVMLEAEIKRLRRAGNLTEAKEKEAEIQKILQKKANKDRAIENLKKAREVKAENKRKREQQERDRNRQQPNFAKMAKKKMQKIADRKAEKKKKSASGGDDKVKSCSMFANVG